MLTHESRRTTLPARPPNVSSTVNDAIRRVTGNKTLVILSEDTLDDLGLEELHRCQLADIIEDTYGVDFDDLKGETMVVEIVQRLASIVLGVKQC